VRDREERVRVGLDQRELALLAVRADAEDHAWRPLLAEGIQLLQVASARPALPHEHTRWRAPGQAPAVAVDALGHPGEAERERAHVVESHHGSILRLLTAWQEASLPLPGHPVSLD